MNPMIQSTKMPLIQIHNQVCILQMPLINNSFQLFKLSKVHLVMALVETMPLVLMCGETKNPLMQKGNKLLN